MEHTLSYLRNLHERDIHPFLVRYLAKKLNIYSKTVYHESSTKGSKGKNEWLHPDVVGFNLPVESWNEKVLGLCENFSINRATIYSFELKKSITVETLREQFFQAVSNSSWANEGYLVGVDIDVDNQELIQEINRLSSAFGIGVIKLNLINCEESEILFPSIRKHVLDGETMNKLFNINIDFRDFVQTAIDSIKINHPVVDKFDSVLSKADLKEILQNSIKSDVKNSDTNDTINGSNNDANNGEDVNSIVCADKHVNLDTDFTGTTPIGLIICGERFKVDSWRDLYVQVCNYMIEKDSTLFVESAKKVRGKKRLYFSTNKSDIFRAFLFEKINIYGELNFSANDIIKNIKKLANEFKINPKEIIISLAD